MKKLLVSMVALIMMIATTAVSFAEGAPVYLVLGDSISTGYGLAEGEKGFAEIVAEKNGYTLINRAINGNVAPGILAQLADSAVLADVAKADLITITCGGNDLMALLLQQMAAVYNANVPDAMTSLKVKPEDVITIMANANDPRQQALMVAAQTAIAGNAEMGVTPLTQSDAMKDGIAAYLQNLGAIMQTIRTANPDVTIIMTTQYNPYGWFDGDYAALSQGVDAGVMALSKFISDYAAVLGYQVADVYTAFADSEANLMNSSMEPLNLDVHPNAAGHAVIADCFNGVLHPAAGENE